MPTIRNVHTSDENYHLNKWVRLDLLLFAFAPFKSHSFDLFPCVRHYNIYLIRSLFCHTLLRSLVLVVHAVFLLSTFYYFIFSVLETFQISHHHDGRVCMCAFFSIFRLMLSGFRRKKKNTHPDFVLSCNVVCVFVPNEKNRLKNVLSHNGKRRRNSKTNKHRVQCNSKAKIWRNFFYLLAWKIFWLILHYISLHLFFTLNSVCDVR